jgi:hypothetical protein
MPNDDVLSAFLDNEPFDAHALATSLAEPGGRELLLDLIALRALVQDERTAATAPIDVRALTRQRRLWIGAGFAAATLLFGVGGALTLKLQQAVPAAVTQHSVAPPQPDRVVTFEPGVEWHDINR